MGVSESRGGPFLGVPTIRLAINSGISGVPLLWEMLIVFPHCLVAYPDPDTP